MAVFSVRIHKTLDFYCRAHTRYNVFLSVFTLFPSGCTLEHENIENGCFHCQNPYNSGFLFQIPNPVYRGFKRFHAVPEFLHFGTRETVQNGFFSVLEYIKVKIFVVQPKTQYNVVLSVFTLFQCVCTLEHVKQCKTALFSVRIHKTLDFCWRAQTQYNVFLSIFTLFPSICTLEHGAKRLFSVLEYIKLQISVVEPKPSIMCFLLFYKV